MGEFASQQARLRAVRQVLWGVLMLNLLVSALKIAVAALSGSVAAFAEVVHGILDASSNVIALVGLSYAHDPPDDRHPYGHQRFESLAALGVGVLIAAGLVEVLRALWQGLSGEREAPAVTLWAVVLMVVTVLCNLAISRYEARRGRELSSNLLTADAAHTMSDGLGVMVVLASFAGVHFGYPWMDTVAALVVAVLIGRTALGILRANAEELLDTAQLDPDEVSAIATGVAGVRHAYAIRSRGRPSQVALDLRIHVDGRMTLDAAHTLSHRVEDALRAAIAGIHDVVIHIEPEPQPAEHRAKEPPHPASTKR